MSVESGEDDEPVAAPAPAPAKKKSDEPGVMWNKACGKWIGQINDQLERTAGGGKKYEHTTYFADEAACIVATRALRKQIDEKYWATVEARAAADPLTKGLPRGPREASEAELGVVYWRPNQNNDHQPYRAVRVGKKRKVWFLACQHDGCKNVAAQTVQGKAREFCATHGGHCPHGHRWTGCHECNPNAAAKKSAKLEPKG